MAWPPTAVELQFVRPGRLPIDISWPSSTVISAFTGTSEKESTTPEGHRTTNSSIASALPTPSNTRRSCIAR